MAPKASLKKKGAEIFSGLNQDGETDGAARPAPLRAVHRISPVPPPLARDESPEEAPASPPPPERRREKPRPWPTLEASVETAPGTTEETAPTSGAARPGKAAEPSAAQEPASPSSDRAWLSEQVDLLYRMTVESISENAPLSDLCLGLLARARALLENNYSSPAEIEALMERVRATLERAERSVRASRRYGPPLAGYSMVWFLIFFLLVLFDREIAAALAPYMGRADMTSLTALAPFWNCLIWGGIGSIAGALFGLHQHIASRDFDSERKIGYVVQPVLGMISGALVYLVVGLVFVVMGEGRTFATTTITVINPLVLLAALVGFQQRHVYGLLEGALERILRAPDKRKAAA